MIKARLASVRKASPLAGERGKRQLVAALMLGRPVEYSEEAKDRIAAEKRRRRMLELGILVTMISPFVADMLGFPGLGPYVFALCLVATVAVQLDGQIARLAERIDRRR